MWRYIHVASITPSVICNGSDLINKGITCYSVASAMAHLTARLRYLIQFEYERSKNITKVAKRLKLNRKTVRLWVRRGLTTQSVATKKGQGRKPSFDKPAARLAVDMLMGGKYSGSKEVAHELHKLGKTRGDACPHRTTVARHAKAVAHEDGEPIWSSMRKPVKQLSKDTMAKRLAFCHNNKTRAWGHIMFTDRKKFHFYYPGVSVKKVSWLRKGQKRVAPKVNHAMCVNMYAGITAFGVTKPHFVAGTSKMPSVFTNKKGVAAKNITTNEYKHVVAQTLLPEGKKLFNAQGLSNWVLQQDNDPTHKKGSIAALTEWSRTNPGCCVTLLPNWPPNSPDLSPIENVWAYVQGKVDAVGCQNFNDFSNCVVNTFQNLPQDMLTKLYASMKNRVAECIKAMGDKTGY